MSEQSPDLHAIFGIDEALGGPDGERSLCGQSARSSTASA